jgi:NTP pyrophosphatase (non-canonical NTP hydrolase)
MTGEVGELAALLEKHVWYGKGLDLDGLVEELGDLCWYIAELCNATGLDLGVILATNIAKLRKRYPDRYTDFDQENRDEKAEREAMKQLTTPLVSLEPTSLGTRFLDTVVVQDGHGFGHLEYATYGEASSLFEGKQCERCSAPATRMVNDTSLDSSNEEQHWFCTDHDRPSAVLKSKN